MTISWEERERQASDDQREEALILVCGLPNSGNRALMKALQMSGADSTILHGTPELPPDDPDRAKTDRRGGHRVRPINRPGRTFAVFITRDSVYRAKSYRTKRLYQWHQRWSDTQHVTNMMDALSWNEIPTLIVSYEGFVKHPWFTVVSILNDMNKTLGTRLVTPTIDQLAFVKDANAKYKD